MPKIEWLLPPQQRLSESAAPNGPPTGFALLFLDSADGKLKVVKPGGGVVDLEGSDGLGGASWGGITGTLSSQTDLQNALNAKAASSHAHAISDSTGLQPALDGKAASSHGHAIADVTGLQTALDGKQAAPIANGDLGSGTANSSTYLRGDRTWGTPTASVAAPFIGSQAPGSFTVADGQFGIQGKRLSLTASQRGTMQGSGRLIVIG